MPRDYGQIQSAFWTHPDIKPLSIEAKLLAAYLLTGPHTNPLGCFYVPVDYIGIDLKLPSETVAKGLVELFGNGFLYHCAETEYVLIPKFLKWNQPANLNIWKARVKEIESLPTRFCFYKELSEAANKHGCPISIPKRDPIETVSKRSQTLFEQQNRTEQRGTERKKTKKNSRARGSVLPQDWELPKSWGQWALAEGFDTKTIKQQAEMFKDYWHSIPGRHGVRTNWKAVWRNWMRNSVKFNGTKPTGPKPQSHKLTKPPELPPKMPMPERLRNTLTKAAKPMP